MFRTRAANGDAGGVSKGAVLVGRKLNLAALPEVRTGVADCKNRISNIEPQNYEVVSFDIRYSLFDLPAVLSRGS
jgi:hypothetical protein